MAETDILNPPDWPLPPKGFNPNPSYGFSRKPTNNRQMQRPRLGPFNSRDVMNGGHIFSLTWVNTTLEISDRVTNFYHDFKDGYFTFIDVDANNRHHVGRFTSEPNPIHPGNGKYTIQGVTFEEVPTARMLVYPSDFCRYGHTLYVVDDFTQRPRVAMMVGNWVTQVSPLAGAGASATAPASYEAFNAAAAAGDWAQTQYTGWGFQMGFRMDATLGKVNIFLDGAQVVTGLDLSSGAATNVSALVELDVIPAEVDALPSVVQVMLVNVPLDIHRVKVYAAGAGAAGGNGIVFPALRYIY